MEVRATAPGLLSLQPERPPVGSPDIAEKQLQNGRSAPGLRTPRHSGPIGPLPVFVSKVLSEPSHVHVPPVCTRAAAAKVSWDRDRVDRGA